MAANTLVSAASLESPRTFEAFSITAKRSEQWLPPRSRIVQIESLMSAMVADSGQQLGQFFPGCRPKLDRIGILSLRNREDGTQLQLL